MDLHSSSTVGGQAILTSDSDSLGGLSCAAGELAGWDGADWVCVSDNTLDAQDVVDAVTAAAVDLHADATVGGLAILTEVDDQDTLNLLTIGVATVGPDKGPVEQVLQQVAQMVEEAGVGELLEDSIEFHRR